MTREIQPEAGHPSGAREKAREVARQGAEAVQEQRGYVASSAGAIARALDRAADSLAADGHPNLADMISNAARGLEDAGDSIAYEDPRTLISELQSFAHRSPTAFIGGAAAIGFGLARLLESAPPEEQEESAELAESTAGPMTTPTTEPVTEPLGEPVAHEPASSGHPAPFETAHYEGGPK